MLKLILDLLLILLMYYFTSSTYTEPTAPYWTPISSFGLSALTDPSIISRCGILFFGSIVFIFNFLVGSVFIFGRNWLNPGSSFIEVLLINLLPILFHFMLIALKSLQNIPLSGNYLIYFLQLAACIERTTPFFMGGLIVWKITVT